MDAREFIAGTVGGCAGIFAGHPIDVVKVRLQSAPTKFSNALDCVKKTFVKEGVGGFFKGLTPPIVSNAPISAIVFGTYGTTLRLLSQIRGGVSSPNDRPNMVDVAIGGFASGAVSSIIVSPAEMIKIRLQMVPSRNVLAQNQLRVSKPTGTISEFRDSYRCIIKIIREGGIRNLFRGFQATLARESLGNAFYFAAYESTLRALTPQGKQPNTLTILAAGSLGGFFVWAPVYPIDVLKTRRQACTEKTQLSTTQFVRKILVSEGAGAFFRGFLPTIVRALPVNAITFLVFEEVNRGLRSV